MMYPKSPRARVAVALLAVLVVGIAAYLILGRNQPAVTETATPVATQESTPAATSDAAPAATQETAPATQETTPAATPEAKPAAPAAAAPATTEPTAPSAPGAAMAPAAKVPHLILQLKDGPVDIELLPGVAPKHVERVVTLTNEKFYDGIIFHRVIEGFMAQTGDPTGTGMGGSDKPDVVAEFNKESFTRGAVGAARSQDPNSFNSQFFICFADCTFLNGNYTVFGRVVSGMEAVDKITRGEPPANPDKIISATIEEK